MRAVLPTLLGCLVLFAGCGDAPQAAPRPPTRAALARLAFDALQAGDFERFRVALPTAADTHWMLEARAGHVAPERVQSMRDLLAKQGGADAVVADAEKRIRTTFEATRQVAAPSIDWTEATFEGLVEAQSRSIQSEGLELAEVFFTFAHAGRQEIVQLVRCARVAEGWIVTGGLRYERNPHADLADATLRLARVQLRTLQEAAELYRLKYGRLPESVEVLQAPDPETGEALLPEVFLDPWEHPFHVDVEVADGDAVSLRLTSAGPDGELDTEDDVLGPEPDAE